jgi:DNA-binding XRE family transcriptional regulator
MDSQKLKEVYERLELLDDRLGHKLRARPGTSRQTVEQLEDRVRDVVAYASELRELVRDLVLAFAKPQAAK